MAWITLTEADVTTKLSGPELAAMKTAALSSGQANPLPEVIGQVTKEIRGFVAACERNQLGDLGTIPDELVGAAISRIRFELAGRLPVASLLTDDRRKANDNALALFREVASCRFLVVGPKVLATDQPPGSQAKLISTTTRKATREKMKGL